MERLGYTGYSLSKALDTSEAVISNIRKGKNPPNVLLVRALLKRHDDVDAGWLLNGKGDMFRSTPPPNVMPSTVQTEVITDGGGLLGAMDARLKRIETLLERMTSLQVERDVIVDESISDLERTMRTLEQEWKEVRKDRHKKP